MLRIATAKSLLRSLAGAAVVSAWTASGCSDNRGDGRGFLGGELSVVQPCPTTTPECGDSGPPPTYVNDVQPILAAHCTGCHGPGGQRADIDLTSYTSLMGRLKGGTSTVAQTAGNLVVNCQMPPPPLPRLSPSEVATFYCWLPKTLEK